MKFIKTDTSLGGVDGGVFITDINPQSSGNVGNKIYSSDGQVLDSCVSDTQLLRISILAITGNTNYKPVVTIKGSPVTLSASSDKPLFTGTIDIDLESADSITVSHEDGASHTTLVSTEVPPIILSAYFTGEYPGSQTELKAGDTHNLYFETDKDVVKIEIDNYGTYTAQDFTFTARNSHTIAGIIADRGDSAQLLGAKIRVQTSSGSYSDWYLTEDDGAVEKVNLINLNNLYPSFTFNSITYPVGQQALKDSETADINVTASNYDSILYNSPNGQLAIPDTSAYSQIKTVTRIAGDYNISINNYRIVATRNANNSSTTYNNVVYIANTACTLTVSTPSTRLRSGGNDGTAAQNYTITITSNQNLLQAPTLTAPVGTWQGTGFSGSGTTWTRSIQIHDNDTKGTYSFSAISGINLAGIETTIFTGSDEYTLGGFVTSITLAAFKNEANMNVEAITYSKVSLTWSVKALPTREALNSSPPIVDAWCLVALETNPTTIRILDTSATGSSSQESTITIQEAI